MIDYFALLQQPRRPWLEADLVKRQYLALTAGAHPDRTHSPSPEARSAASHHFAELNAAFNCLREPRDRLRHLIELELGRRPGDLKNVPRELADLFLQIATASRTTERLMAEKTSIQSALLLAGFLGQIQAHLTVLERLQAEVASLQGAALNQLKGLDASWQNPADRQTLLPQLEELAQILGFYLRWQAQLQEAHFRLTV